MVEAQKDPMEPPRFKSVHICFTKYPIGNVIFLLFVTALLVIRGVIVTLQYDGIRLILGQDAYHIHGLGCVKLEFRTYNHPYCSFNFTSSLAN